MSYEETVEKAKEILDGIELPFVLFGSTLLGIYREDKPIGSILEFVILKDDLTDAKMEALKQCGYYHGWRNGNVGISIIDLEKLYDGMFELHIFRFTDKYAYLNLTSDEVLFYPKEMWLRENWGTLNWRGKDYHTPKNVEEYLELQYGKDWKTPQESSWGGSPSHAKLVNIGIKL